MASSSIRFTGALLHNLAHSDLTSPTNSWLFTNSDETLTRQIRDAISNIAREWLSHQSESTLQTLYYDHVSFDDIMPKALTAHCLDFLAPKDDTMFQVPLQKDAEDLSGCILVNKNWNQLAHQKRYKNIDKRGTRFRSEPLTNAADRTASIAAFWRRTKPKCLKCYDTKSMNAMLDGACVASENDPSLRIDQILVQGSSDEFWTKVDPRLPLFSSLKGLAVLETVGNQLVTTSQLHAFLLRLRERQPCQDFDLLAVSLECPSDADGPGVAEMFEIPSLLPPSITELNLVFWPPALPHWVAYVITCLPRLNTLNLLVDFNSQWFHKLRHCQQLEFLQFVNRREHKESLSEVLGEVGLLILANASLKCVAILFRDTHEEDAKNAKSLMGQASEKIDSVEVESLGQGSRKLTIRVVN